MRRLFWFRSRLARGGLLALTLALVAAAALAPARPAAAQPAAGATPVRFAADALPEALQYVPPDAAFFVHADVAHIWGSELVKSFRNADKKVFDLVEERGEKILGTKIADLKTVT